MKRWFYSSSISNFINSSKEEILGKLSTENEFDLLRNQRDAWNDQIDILKESLLELDGELFFEYSIPRMGLRIDVLLIVQHVLFVLEFKIGEKNFQIQDVDQVWDYALDLKNFHSTSHNIIIAPILISTKAKEIDFVISHTNQNDGLLYPICTNSINLRKVIFEILNFVNGEKIDCATWEQGSYQPTPTIIEAAMALYNGHSVKEISRSDASAKNLSRTTDFVSEIIDNSKNNKQKSICFVTGVPGAGKTLVGLNVATTHIDNSNDLYSVFLSGNGPLVAILREALTRDKINKAKEQKVKLKKSTVLNEVKLFIQNVHHFRDDCLIDEQKAPIEHVALFDEAQRAWNMEQTTNFMARKKNKPNFRISEPEFLISCMDRHKDWAVIVCLVGGGQEINTGEAGIGEWIDAIIRSFSHWKVYISNQLTDSEYSASHILEIAKEKINIEYNRDLHLAVSMRSYRAENVSNLIKQLLDIEVLLAKNTLATLIHKYPIVITRDINKAKDWLKSKARGSERYGIIVSSQAERLRPHAINVKSPMDPVHWFLDAKDDVRSSYFLEDVATEFHIQGLELDWACITWDADFRYSNNEWKHYSFVGNKWNKIKKAERQNYLKNAYRVLLTRARQGMIIVVPNGDSNDPTRLPEFYDGTFKYLCGIGFDQI